MSTGNFIVLESKRSSSLTHTIVYQRDVGNSKSYFINFKKQVFCDTLWQAKGIHSENCYKMQNE